MRTSQLVTSYIQAALYAFVGVRAVMGYARDHDARSGHLALATGLFGTQSLVSALSGTVYDATKGEVAPRAIGILTGILLFLAIFAFLLFLFDFIRVPAAAVVLSAIVTAGFVVLSVIERPDRRFVGGKLVLVPGVNNPIEYLTYVGWAIAYLAIAFGILWVAFLVYSFRVRGLARFRMVSIAGGFLLLFVAIGLIPRLLFGNPSSSTIMNLTNVVRYLALGSAPLLLIGFTPPAWLTRLIAGGQEGEAGV